MPHCKSKYSVKRNLLLTAIGIGLQTAGSICLIASVVGIGKEINQRINAVIIKELMKQGSAE